MRRRALVIAAALLCAQPAPLLAQDRSPPGAPSATEPALLGGPLAPEEVRAIERAERAYNEEDYEGAAEAFLAAAQLRPDRVETWRDAARALFWAGRYAHAAAHYDNYLTLWPAAPDAEQIARERASAARRASSVWSLPRAERRALVELERRLQSAEVAAWSPDAQGAHGAMEALLATGYAQPALVGLRARFVAKVLAEFDRVPATGSMVPSFAPALWKRQRARLRAATEAAIAPADRGAIARREAIQRTAEAVIVRDRAAAEAAAEAALKEQDGAPIPLWALVLAPAHAGDAEAALRALPTAPSVGPESDGERRALRAMLLQRAGRAGEALDVYMTLWR